jgi:23S rRNA-/tRNA-specific pseudouridylate synthase
LREFGVSIKNYDSLALEIGSMQKITIENPSDAGQRLDRFLKKYLPNAPLGGIYKMLRTGKIKVNGKKKDQTYKISE